MEYTDKIIWTKGLLVGCPAGKALDNCPIKKLRNLPTEEGMKIVDNMKRDEIESIIEHHSDCLSEKESTSFNFRFSERCKINRSF